jgi:GNAT superfamily N-acetyltransferase
MSLFADYWREKGHIIVETQRGFMSAIVHKTMCYVDNFYVKPEYRGTGSALQLTLQIIEMAKDRGCTDFSAEIYKSDPYKISITRSSKTITRCSAARIDCRNSTIYENASQFH